MTREQAVKEATQIARDDGVRMAVTFNQYDEEPNDREKFGYFPAAAASIFKLDKIVEVIEP
jgi:hypothetical protein